MIKKLIYLNLAAFYGCYLLRTQDSLPYDNRFESECLKSCFVPLGQLLSIIKDGLYIVVFPKHATKKSFKIAVNYLKEAIEEAGAGCLVTPCPLCYLNLDFRQP